MILLAAAISLPVLTPAAPGDEASVNFSFDQVDIPTFVKLVGEMTGKKFVLSEGVQGKITVVSPLINRKEVFPLFVSILESAGCSVVEDNGIYRVVPLQKRDTPAAPVVGADETSHLDGIITKVIRLQNVSAQELRKVLESKVGGGKAGAIAAIEETNHLLITDTAESIRRIEKIVAEIDRPGTSRTTEVVPLQYASAEELAGQLNTAVAESESRGEQLKNRLPDVPGSSRGIRMSAIVVPAPHSNSLILVGTQGQITEFKRLIALMDVDTASGRGRLNAIFLKYMSATEAATNINSLLMKSTASKADSSALQKMKIAIEADAGNNALLVDASPSDFDIMKRLIEQLDQLPRQVHISVIIAEITTNDGSVAQVEMAGMGKPSLVGDTVIEGSSLFNDSGSTLMDKAQSGVFPKGITVGVAYGTSVDSSGNVTASIPGLININALKQQSWFKVVSETSLGVQNNKEASVNIVDDIPVLKSTVQGGTGIASVIQNIDRLDVGIKLKLLPHIIPGGDVQMTLSPSIEAVTDPGPSGQYAPTIAKRDVTTTVTVRDGRTIIIAGLTRTDTTKSKAWVPILGRIPLIGMLFRSSADKVTKTNMLILVTPTIVTDPAAAENVLRDWQKKTDLGSHEEK
jgi:general secretion pathway protein D